MTLSSIIERTVNTGTSLYWSVRGLPGQAHREIALFREILLAPRAHPVRVFEWGLGRSTVYYTRMLANAGCEFAWYGVDNSIAWHARVQRRIDRAPWQQRVHLGCAPFPAFWQLPGYVSGRPMGFEAFPHREAARRYIEFPRILGIAFDVMIVDGRFRRRCVLAAREVLDQEGIVLLHDAQRTHYHASFAAYPYGRLVEGGRLPGSSQRSKTWIGSMKPSAWCGEQRSDIEVIRA